MWTEVGFWLPTKLNGSLFFIPDKLSGSWFWKFCPTWAELFFANFSWNASKITFLVGYHWERFFLRALPKTPIPSAITWRSILKNCSRSTHKKFGFGGYHLRTTMDKMPFSPATTWREILLCKVRMWMFFLEVYEDCSPKPVDKSLLNVLTSRGSFFWSRWKPLFEIPNIVRDIQKLDD